MRLTPCLLILCVACGRSEPVSYAAAAAPPVASEDAGIDAGIDAGVDAGFDAGTCPHQPYALEPAGKRPIDVLLVIDNSCSMEDDQAQLAHNFDVFFNAFTANQVDFHLGAITTDSGGLRGYPEPYLTANTPFLRERFNDIARPGSSGSANETALRSLSQAIKDPPVYAQNAGFFRKEADLAVVFLGDEDDHSTVLLSTLADEVKRLKTGGQAITVAAIVGLDDCTGGPARVSGWRITRFARRFPRNTTAVCTTDYASILAGISGQVVNARCLFDLRRPLDVSRVVNVTIGGQPVGWTYFLPDDAHPNGALQVTPCPQSGGTVAVAYADECP